MAKRKPRPKSDSEDPLLSIADVARRLGFHWQTIKSWVESGGLPHIVLPNGLVRIRQSVVDDILRGTDHE